MPSVTEDALLPTTVPRSDAADHAAPSPRAGRCARSLAVLPVAVAGVLCTALLLSVRTAEPRLHDGRGARSEAYSGPLSFPDKLLWQFDQLAPPPPLPPPLPSSPLPPPPPPPPEPVSAPFTIVLFLLTVGVGVMLVCQPSARSASAKPGTFRILLVSPHIL